MTGEGISAKPDSCGGDKFITTGILSLSLLLSLAEDLVDNLRHRGRHSVIRCRPKKRISDLPLVSDKKY